MSTLIHFGTDGWHARRDGDFTEGAVVRAADAAGTYWAREYPNASVCVGYDAREGARDYAVLAARVLAAHDLDAVLSDRALPTPALSWTVAQDEKVCGGLMVTGAYHPDDYLGIKLRVGNGGTGDSVFIEDVENLIDPDPTEKRGDYRDADMLSGYLAHMRRLVHVDQIRRARMSVVLDPMFGPATTCVAELLESMGVHVAEIHRAGDDGHEDMRPEPVEPWVDECEQMVAASSACMGLVLDGDAERLGVVDENGLFVSAQKVAALLLGHLVVDRGMSGHVVVSVATSQSVRMVAKSLGCRVTVRPMGFRSIYESMARGGALMGTEGAGGVSVPSHMPERDGILAALLLCELVAMAKEPVGELVKALDRATGSLFYGKRDVRRPLEEVEMLGNILPGLNPAEVAGEAPCDVSHMDGLRLSFEDGSWVLVRPSRTDPVVRVYAEARTPERRDDLMDAAARLAL